MYPTPNIHIREIDYSMATRPGELKYDLFLLELRLEGTRSIVAQDLILHILLRAKPRGPTAESSAVLEGALRCDLSTSR